MDDNTKISLGLSHEPFHPVRLVASKAMPASAPTTWAQPLSNDEPSKDNPLHPDNATGKSVELKERFQQCLVKHEEAYKLYAKALFDTAAKRRTWPVTDDKITGMNPRAVIVDEFNPPGPTIYNLQWTPEEVERIKAKTIREDAAEILQRYGKPAVDHAAAYTDATVVARYGIPPPTNALVVKGGTLEQFKAAARRPVYHPPKYWSFAPQIVGAPREQYCQFHDMTLRYELNEPLPDATMELAREHFVRYPEHDNFAAFVPLNLRIGPYSRLVIRKIGDGSWSPF